MVMTFAADSAVHGLAQFILRPIIRGHDMRQLMQTRLLTFTNNKSVVRADIHPAQASVGMTVSPATH